MDNVIKIGEGIYTKASNGYTLEKVLFGMKFIDKIHGNPRNASLQELVDTYNFLKNTNETPIGCKPCQMTKFWMGINNYVKYGKMTLLATNKCTEDDFVLNKEESELPIENEEQRLVGVTKRGRKKKTDVEDTDKQ